MNILGETGGIILRIHFVFPYFIQDKWKVKVLVAQSCPALCNPMDCNAPGSSLSMEFQARILDWVAIPFPTEFSQPRDQTLVYHNAGNFFTIWATREAGYRHTKTKQNSNMMLLIFIIFKLFLSNQECCFQLSFKTLQVLSHLVWSSWAFADKDCCIQQSLTTLYVII